MSNEALKFEQEFKAAVDAGKQIVFSFDIEYVGCYRSTYVLDSYPNFNDGYFVMYLDDNDTMITFNYTDIYFYDDGIDEWWIVKKDNVEIGISFI